MKQREIKFRVWSETKKKMYEEALVISDRVSMNNDLVIVDPDGTTCVDGESINDAIFLQFTGLKDKNGKEIYEGDLVRVWISDSDMGIQEVEWDDESLCWSIGGEWGFDYDVFEVIGNIYENPNLLEHAIDR